MSKLDYVTIAIVAVCVAALIYLVYSVINLMGDPRPAPTEQAAEPPADDFYEEGDTLVYDEAGEMVTDDAGQAGADGGRLENDPLPTYTEENETGGKEGAQASYREEAGTAESSYEPERAPESYSPAGDYLVIAGAYRYRDNAQTEADRLRKLGYDRAEVSIFDRGAYATVLVNRFSEIGDARALARELKDRHGIEAYVQKKK